MGVVLLVGGAVTPGGRFGVAVIEVTKVMEDLVRQIHPPTRIPGDPSDLLPPSIGDKAGVGTGYAGRWRKFEIVLVASDGGEIRRGICWGKRL